MRKVKINNYESFRYVEVFKILSWKDDCVWKAEPIGYLEAEYEYNINRKRYITCSLSTTMYKNPSITLSPVYSVQELID